jgi:hypothetical protein
MGLGLADAIHETSGVEQRVGLIEQLFDVECDFEGLFDIAGVGADLGRLGDGGSLIEPSPDFRDVRLERGFEYDRVHGGSLHHHTHAPRRSEVERKGEQSYGSFPPRPIMIRRQDF